MKARRRAATIGALTLVLLPAGCKTLDEVAVERDRCHELGGEFSSWPIEQNRYGTSCDLSDERG